ncbi:hypothetical protein BJX65DRAFT_313521 [Aspergillus insuetus]
MSDTHRTTSSLRDTRPKPTTKRKNVDRDLEQDIQARRSRRAKLGKPTDLDPTVCLNTDVLNIVFDHLEVADIVRCERVSPKWKVFVQVWMERFAVAKKLRACVPRQMITNSDVHLSYTHIKEYACRFHNMRSGRVSSIFEHRQAYYSVVNGNYMAWTVPHQRDCESAPEVYWLRTSSTKLRRRVDLAKLLEWEMDRPIPPIAVEIVMNTKGVLLLDVMMGGGIGRTRTVAFCPNTMTKLWHRDYETDGVDRDEVALDISESVAYCAVKQVGGTGYDLAALDLGTGSPLYKLPLTDRVRWVNDHMYPRKKYALQPLISVVEDRLGQELLFVKHAERDDHDPWARDSAIGIDVFNGRTGQLLHTISFPDTVVGSCIHDPLTNHNLVAWYKWGLKVPALAKHTLGIFRPVSSVVGRTLFTAPALAVCYPQTLGIDWLIDPLNMVAIGKQTVRHDGPALIAWKLIYRRLEPVQDVALHNAAALEVKRLFSNEQGAMGTCLTMAGEAEPVTAPHAFTGIRENMELCRPVSSIIEYLSPSEHFAGDGKVMIRSMCHGKLLDFV